MNAFVFIERKNAYRRDLEQRRPDLLSQAADVFRHWHRPELRVPNVRVERREQGSEATLANVRFRTRG